MSQSTFVNGVHDSEQPAGRMRLCRNSKSAISTVMPVKTGIQNILKLLDSPVSSTGQAHRRASLEYNPAGNPGACLGMLE